MRVSDKAIVLQVIRHGDKKFIVKLFTEQHGLLTAFAAAGKSATAKVKVATLMPLSLLKTELIVKQNRELQQLTETSCYYVSQGFSGSLAKLSIAQFMNEVLIKTLKEQSANSHLFHFVETCLKYLSESENDFMQLHLYFLFELSKYLGFEPQNNYSNNELYFDCREGKFTSQCLAFPLGLNHAESALFSKAIVSNLLRQNLSNVERQQLLEALLAYYALHVPSFGQMKSLEVLRQLSH